MQKIPAKKVSRIKKVPTKKEYVGNFSQTDKKMTTKLFPWKNSNIFVKKGYLEFKKKCPAKKKYVGLTH